MGALKEGQGMDGPLPDHEIKKKIKLYKHFSLASSPFSLGSS